MVQQSTNTTCCCGGVGGGATTLVLIIANIAVVIHTIAKGGHRLVPLVHGGGALGRGEMLLLFLSVVFEVNGVGISTMTTTLLLLSRPGYCPSAVG